MAKIAKARMASLVILLVISFVAITFPITYAAPHTDITATTAWNMMTNGTYPNLVILDVRNQSEYDTGYIPKAKLIPLWQLQQRIGELSAYKNTEIIAYCKNGSRAHDASILLDANGFTKVYDLTGGLNAWNSSRYAITTPAAGYTETAGWLNSAHFAVRFPPAWNGMLVVHCRGGSLPAVVPDVRLSGLGFTNVASELLPEGFAVAASAYGGVGFCIRRAMNDTYDLTKYLIDTFQITGKVFITGISIGGGIALLLGEKYPNVYSGVLDMCGVKDMESHYETKVRWASLSDADLTAELKALTAPVPPYMYSSLASLRDSMNRTAADMAVECGGTPANASKAYEDISPTYHASISIPVITVHGTSDSQVPYYQALMYQTAVANAGRSNLYRLYTVVGGQHGDPPVLSQRPSRFEELVHMSNDNHQVSLDVSAFQSVTVMSGWTWWFFAHNQGGTAPYTYQWYEGLTPLQGQTSMILPVTKNTPGAYNFFCRVTDAQGTTTTSNAITLTVR
jgi:rhodanese-related sulfurtransferase/esterase/lipase